jgi:hypothetical protein
LYNLRILAESSLIVILSIEFNLELRATFNEGCSPVLPNRVAVLLSQQGISYILYSSKLGRKSSRVEVKDMLNNYILLCLKKLHGVRRAIALKRYSTLLIT